MKDEVFEKCEFISELARLGKPITNKYFIEKYGDKALEEINHNFHTKKLLSIMRIIIQITGIVADIISIISAIK